MRITPYFIFILTIFTVQLTSLEQDILKSDELGNCYVLTFGEKGQVEAVMEQNPEGVITAHRKMKYDEIGNKISESHAVIGGNNRSSYTVEWTFNDASMLTSVIEATESPSPRRTSYIYNDSLQLSAMVKPDGQKLYLDYTAEGQISRLYLSDFSLHYSYMYDEKGNLTEAKDHVQGCTTTREFDAEGHLLSETFAHGLKVIHEYGAEGRTQMMLPDRSAIQYSYHQGLLQNITRFSCSGEELYSCPVGNQMHSSAPDITAYWSLAIERGPLHTKHSLKDGVGSLESQFTYDSRGQIVEENGALQRSYSYDSLRNRVAQDGLPWVIDEYNQLIATGSDTFSWDLNGNCTSRKSLADGRESSATYTYDVLNRLIAVEIPGTRCTRYAYDPFHRRISKKSFIWDAENAAFQLDAEEFYLYDKEREIAACNHLGNVHQLRLLKAAFSDSGAAIAIELNGKAYLPVHNASGSVSALLDLHTLSPCEYYRYTAFGEILFFDGAGQPQTASACDNPWQFCSKRYDKESGLTFFGMRYYSPTMGRWISADPCGFIDSINRFVFLHNDPLNYSDLYGLFSIPDLWEGGVNFLSVLYDTFTSFIAAFRAAVSLETHIAHNIEEWSHEGFGAHFLHLVGFHDEPPEMGVFGQGECNDKIRITFVNGILNLKKDLLKSAEMISDSHGGTNVHYIYRPTLGWSWDVLKSMLVKLGYISEQAVHIAATWKRLINEMGGSESGDGLIIHYAHSIGSADTFMAKKLLTPEEQQMIKVITFGSPSLLPSEGFQSVTHYVSVRDAIPFLDAGNHILALLRGDKHIIPIGSYMGIPFIDHMLDSHTYRTIIEMLGKEFKNHYVPAL